MKNIFSLLLFLCILVSGCKKNIDNVEVIDAPEIPVILSNYNPVVVEVTSSVFGTVTDEIGDMVEGAMVTIDGQTEVTDPFGTFKFENINMNKNGTFIKIEKAGFFTSGRRFYPQNSETSRVRIELLQKDFSHAFKTETGGEITFENNGKVVFAPNSIQKENGENYTGGVLVAMKWLDPAAAETLNQMPGALLGVNLDGQEQVLETYGMIAVELESDIGEPLNIASGKKAEIQIPIPNELLSNAPAEIPLWSFNDELGVWVEEGKALLENDFYIGEVQHFSFWNCDFPRDLVSFTLKLIEESTGEILQELKTEIKFPDGSSGGSSFSNEQGEVSGLIPANELLQLKVYDGCGEVIFENEIGPFTADLDLGELNIPFQNQTILKGKLLNCNGEKLNDGFVIVNNDGQQYFYEVQDTLFEIFLPICVNANSLRISGGDLSTFEMGEIVEVDFQDTLNVGTLISCGEGLINYAKVTLNEESTTIIPLKEQGQNLADGTTSIFFQHPEETNPLISLNFTFQGLTVGDYSNSGNDLISVADEDLILAATEEKLENFEILEYGDNIGDRISGRMSGLVNNLFSTIPEDFIEIEFIIIRDF